ncbi:MBL fold metallo-hydrolase [Isosphaeraceae bacterium EP7]
MRHRLVRACALLAVGIAVACLPSHLSARTPGAVSAIIEFLDVGQGDSILIRSPEGKTALIDAGPSNGVVQSLKAKGLTSIDFVALTHHHSDHYGGMRQVIEHFKPKYFLATNSTHTTSMYLKVLQQVKDQNVQLIRPTQKPRHVELGSVLLTIFPQPPMNADEENDNSIGIRVSYGSVSVILTGDSEESERAWWTEHHPELLRDATILKLAHHGSRNGTDAAWIDLIRPELTVASLATGNSYGHPHSETVSLLKKKRIPLLQTNKEGSIRINTDGEHWSVAREQLAKGKTGAETKHTSSRRY